MIFTIPSYLQRNGLFLLFQFALEAGPTISLPNIIREGCHEDAYDMVNKNNSNNSASTADYVQNPKILGLISSFTALMLHIKKLSDGER